MASMSLLGTIFYEILAFGVNSITGIFSFVAKKLSEGTEGTLFWLVILITLICVVLVSFGILFMYTSFFAFILYPLLVILLGPALVLALMYTLYVLVRSVVKKKRASESAS